MFSGIIYGYFWRDNPVLLYLGKTTGSLETRHRGHLSSWDKGCPFDILIRRYGEESFDLKVLDTVHANTKTECRTKLHELETKMIQELRPVYNEVNTGFRVSNLRQKLLSICGTRPIKRKWVKTKLLIDFNKPVFVKHRLGYTYTI